MSEAPFTTEKQVAHTPGPWQFYADLPSTDPNWHIVTNASRMRVLANVHIEPGNAMDLANAHLITAAPDLLELAKQCAGECADCGGTRLEPRCCGQTAPQGGSGENVCCGKPYDVPCESCADIWAIINKAEGRV